MVAVGGSISIHGPAKGDVDQRRRYGPTDNNAVIEGEVTAIGGGADQEPSSRAMGGIQASTKFPGHKAAFSFRAEPFAVEIAASLLRIPALRGRPYALALLILALAPSHVANVAEAFDT